MASGQHKILEKRLWKDHDSVLLATLKVMINKLTMSNQLNILFFFLITLACFSYIYLRISSCFFFSSSYFWVVSCFSFAASSLLRLISSRRSRFFCFSFSLSWLKPSGSSVVAAAGFETFTSSPSFSSGLDSTTFFTGAAATGFLTSSSSLSDDSYFFFLACWGAPPFFPGCYFPFLGAGFSSESSESLF